MNIIKAGATEVAPHHRSKPDGELSTIFKNADLMAECFLFHWNACFVNP